MTRRVLRRENWLRLLGLFTVASFVEAMFFGQLGAFVPLYLPQLGVAARDIPVWTGALAAFTGAIGLPFLPFWGALADRYARQPVIVRSFVVEMLAAGAMLLAGNIWVFVIGRCLTSLALGNTGLMLTTLSEQTPGNRQGLVFSIVNSAAPVGAFLGPLISGPLVDAWGFPTLLAINAVLFGVVALAMSFGYHDSFHGANRGSLTSMAVESVRIIGRSPRLRTLFPALFLLFAGWTLAMAYAPLVVATLYHGDQLGTAVGMVLGAGGLATLVLSPLIGMMGDRWGHWRVLSWGAAVAVVLWPLPLLTTGLVSFGMAWALINGVASAVFAMSFVVLSGSATENERGRVMAFAFLPMNVGFTLGPAIGSIVTRGGLFAIFPTAAVLTALGLAVLLHAARQPLQAQEP